MPITHSFTTQRITQEEFAPMAYEVMEQVFAIHNEFGRFFDERIYKRELANRLGGVQLEVPVEVTHRSFTKRYFADALVRGSGLFEFKATEAIHDRHVGQGINYLLVLDLAHGKIINVRPERVESRFVNCHQRLVDLRDPVVVDAALDLAVAGAEGFREILMALIRDWGAGLELELYRDALTHFFGGEAEVWREATVFGPKGTLGRQKLRFVAPDVVFELTALPSAEHNFAIHAQRMIAHTGLKAIHWANLTQKQITFTTIRSPRA